MPFFKMLASLGIGGARVDTRLDNATLRAGEELRGVVHIQGGHVEQRVDRISLHLMVQYLQQDNDRLSALNTVFRKWQISQPFTLQPGEKKELPFALRLPPGTPTTLGGAPVWLKTGLDIDNAINPEDSDRVQVLPHPWVQTVLDAVTGLGFKLGNAYCEASERFGRDDPFLQEFELRSTADARELELVFLFSDDGLEVLIEVDRRARGFTGLLEQALTSDTQRQGLQLSRADLERGAEHVAQRLAPHLERRTA